MNRSFRRCRRGFLTREMTPKQKAAHEKREARFRAEEKIRTARHTTRRRLKKAALVAIIKYLTFEKETF